MLRRASPAQRPIPRVLNLDVGLTRDASVGGIAAFAVEQGREYGLRLPRPSLGPPDLDQQAAVLLGLDADTAQALFDGPNDIGGARRWIEPADAAKACRLAAAGAPPTELWPDVDTVKLRELARAETIEMYRPDGCCCDAHGHSYGYSLGAVTFSAVSSHTLLGGSLISPHAEIHPSARIGRNVEIAPGARIGPDVAVGAGAVVASAVLIERGARVAPRSELGFGSIVSQSAQVHCYAAENVHVGVGGVVRPAATGERPPMLREAVWVGDGAEVIGHGHSSVPPGTQVPSGARFDLASLEPEHVPPDALDRRASANRTGSIDSTAKVHSTAQIAPDASVGPECDVGPWTVVGSGAVLERSVTLGAEAVVEQRACVGPQCVVGPGASVGRGAVVGANSILGANSRVVPDAIVLDGPLDQGRLVRNDRQLLPAGYQFEGPNFLPVQCSELEPTPCPADLERPALLHPTAKLAPGVQIPPNASIGPGVTISADVVLGAGVQLGSGASVGRGATLGPYSRVEAGVHVPPGTTVPAMWPVSSTGASPGVPTRPSSSGGRSAERLAHRSVAGVSPETSSCVDPPVRPASSRSSPGVADAGPKR